MEFLLELLELLFEIILEGTLELGTSRRVPVVVRSLALLLILALFGGITLLIVIAGIHVLKQGDTLVGVLLLAISFLIAFASIYMVVKKIRRKR